MNITFDPRDQEEVEQVQTILTLLSSTAVVPMQPNANVAGGVEPIPAGAAPVAEPNVAAAPVASGDTDCHGMLWDGELHSTPPSKKQDGSWKARQGRTKELKAAIAAHKAGQPTEPQPMAAPVAPVEQPAPVAPVAQTEPVPAPTMAAPMPGMPGTQPAAPAMAAPVAPYDYATMANDFTAFMQFDPTHNYQVLYSGIGVTNPEELQTNETLRRRVKAFIDARRAGHDDAQAIAVAAQVV